eukprot:7937989-Pyramimonas_sp.AAC.1
MSRGSCQLDKLYRYVCVLASRNTRTGAERGDGGGHHRGEGGQEVHVWPPPVLRGGAAARKHLQVRRGVNPGVLRVNSGVLRVNPPVLRGGAAARKHLQVRRAGNPGVLSVNSGVLRVNPPVLRGCAAAREHFQVRRGSIQA